jgi:hypothetical protein
LLSMIYGMKEIQIREKELKRLVMRKMEEWMNSIVPMALLTKIGSGKLDIVVVALNRHFVCPAQRLRWPAVDR